LGAIDQISFAVPSFGETAGLEVELVEVVSGG
jgi:hypothetical protein